MPARVRGCARRWQRQVCRVELCRELGDPIHLAFFAVSEFGKIFAVNGKQQWRLSDIGN
jgi:hypothetical protein